VPPPTPRRGASPEEIAFLCETDSPPFDGHRVELNALVGRRFIDWLEATLAKNEIEKIVPRPATLEVAYRRA
jgi:hypothetical protein